MTLDALLDLLPWALPALVVILGLAAVLLARSASGAPGADVARADSPIGGARQASANARAGPTGPVAARAETGETGGRGHGDAEVALSHELVADGTWARPAALPIPPAPR